MLLIKPNDLTDLHKQIHRTKLYNRCLLFLSIFLLILLTYVTNKSNDLDFIVSSQEEEILDLEAENDDLRTDLEYLKKIVAMEYPKAMYSFTKEK